MADRRVTIEAVLVDLVTSPLSTISRGFSNLGSGLERIGARLSPVTSGVSNLVTAFISLQGANRAIAAAEESVDAERRLAKALEGRAAEIKAVNDEAARIQDLLGISGDTLLGVAANLKTAGVSAADLPKFLRTAAGASRELQVPVEQVAKSLANLDGEGPAGPLGRILPQLRQMKEEGKSNAEIIDFLAEKFGELDATDVTIFERIRSSQEAFGDEAERIGLVLAEVKRRVLELALEGITKLADVVSSPEFRVFLELLLQYAPALGAVVAGLGGLAVGKTALAFLVAPLGIALKTLGLIIGLFGAPFLGPVLIVASAIAGIAALLGKFPDLLGAIGSAADGVSAIFSPSFGRIREAFDALKEGRITTEQFFEFVKAELSILGLTLKREIFLPVEAFFSNALRKAKEIFGQGLPPALRGERPPGGIVTVERRDINTGELLPLSREEEELADKLAPKKGPTLLEEQKRIDEEIAALTKKRDLALVQSLSDGIDRRREAAEEEIALARSTYETLLRDLAAARARAERAGSVTASLLSLDRGRELTIETVKEILSTVSEAEREAVTEALSRRVTEDLEARRIGLTEFSAFREAIESTLSERRVAEQERLLEAERLRQREIEKEGKSIERVIALRRQELEASAAIADDPVAIEKAREEIEALRRSLTASEVEIGVRLELDQDLESLSTALEGKFGPRVFADSIREAVSNARREIERSGGIVTPKAFDLSAQIREFERAATERPEAAALREVENIRAALESAPVELDVRLRLGEQLDELRRALSGEKIDIGVADSIESALSEIRKTVAAADPLIPPEAFGIGEGLAELEEFARKKKDQIASGEALVEKTEELALLEERRRQNAAALLESVNAEGEATKKLADLAAARARAEGKLREDRRKAVESRVKELESESGSLPQTLGGLEALQKKGGLSADETFRAQNAALDEFVRKLESARDTAREALQIEGPTFGPSFDAAIADLDRLKEGAEGLRLSFEAIEERQVEAFRASHITGEEVESELQNELRRIKTLEIEGIVSRNVAEARAERAIDSTLVALQKAKADLEETIRKSPSLADNLAQDLERIDDAIAKVKATQEDDFFAGLTSGVRGAAAEFDSLAATGARVGSSLVSDLGEGLIDVFVQGEKSFQEFLAQFLEGISVMIARMVILSALSAAIGGTGGVFQGLFNAGGPVPKEFNRGGLVRRYNRGGEVEEEAGPVRRVLRLAAGGWVPALRTAAAGLLLATAAHTASAAAPAGPVQHFNFGGRVQAIASTVGAVVRSLQAAAAAPNRVQYFGPGGNVTGARTHRDTVDAKLTPGEFVQPEQTVDHYGLDLMEGLRRREIPRAALRDLLTGTTSVVKKAEPELHSGGVVDALQGTGGSGAGSAGARGRGGASGFSIPLIVSDKQAADRILSGGMWPEIQAQMNQDQANVRGALFDDGD